MKKTTKNILITLAVLIVLGIAAVLLLTMPEPAAEESSEPTETSQAEAEPIIDGSAADVKQITLKNNIVDETWEIVPVKAEDGTEAIGTFTFKGWEDENLSVSNISTLARSFYTLYAIKEIGNVQNLAEYGLKGDGEIKAVVDYKDGSAETVIVGLPAGESDGRYVLCDGTVYIAPMSALLETKKNDFVTTTVLTMTTPNVISENGTAMEGETVIHKFHFSGKNYPEEILVEKADHKVYSHTMTTPIFAGASKTQLDAITEQLMSITASGVAAVKATDEDKAQWGIDEPTVVLDFEINNEAHKITLGNLTDGEYSLMIDDNDVIYLIPESRVNTWTNKSVFDLREPYVYLVNINEVEKLTVESKSGKAEYNVARALDEEKSTEDEPMYNLTVKKDGKEVTYDTAYQPFYASLLSVCVMNEDNAEPKGDALFTVTYDHFESDDEDVVAFYAHPESDRRCVVTLNGQNVGIVRYSDVADLIEKNEIISGYGTLKEEE